MLSKIFSSNLLFKNKSFNNFYQCSSTINHTNRAKPLYKISKLILNSNKYSFSSVKVSHLINPYNK